MVGLNRQRTGVGFFGDNNSLSDDFLVLLDDDSFTGVFVGVRKPFCGLEETVKNGKKLENCVVWPKTN